MPGQQTCTLWCFVNHRDYDPAPVSVPESVNIDYLKEAIKEKLGLRDVRNPSLVLWKLNDPEPLDPEDTLAERIRKKGDATTFATRLTAAQKVTTLFPQPPFEDHLHVLVQLPSTTKRQRTALCEAVQTLPSDHPLHELWMLARVPQPMLFETRPVQRDNSSETELPSNCMVLKGGEWVQDLQPGSYFTGVLITDEYTKILRAIMEWFLHGDQVTEDAMEVQPAPFENPFLNAPPGHISEQQAFILFGNPGIGKTVFLYVLLVLRLQARLPTIYQTRDTHLYYFDDKGVSVIWMIPGLIATDIKSHFCPSTWCLIDSNDSLTKVPMFIQDLGLFIVQASEARPSCFGWMYKATRPVLRYFMKSWTLSELLIGRVLQDQVYSEAQIEFFSYHYGTSARSVYTYASMPSIYDRTLDLAPFTYEEIDKLVVRTCGLDLSGPVSDQIMLISPGTSRNTFEISFSSRYIYEKLRDRLSVTKLEAISLLYEVFVRFPKTESVAGLMLEDAVTDVFPRGGEWGLVRMERSSRMDSKCTHWKALKGSTQYLHLGFGGHRITIDTNSNPVGTKYNNLAPVPFIYGAQLQLRDGYYVPSLLSKTTFNAFIYESASKTATVFQVTTSSEHSIKEEGIEWLLGLGVEKFRYIAVSPPNIPLDLPFPDEWDGLIPEKYLLTVESFHPAPRHNGCIHLETLKSNWPFCRCRRIFT